MFKPVLLSVLALLSVQAHATFCDSGLLIYHAEEKTHSLLTQVKLPNTPQRVVELCKQSDGFAFYFGNIDPREPDKEFMIPLFSLKTEPESPKGGFNFTHNNIEYSLFEDDLSLLYLYEDKALIDVIELDNHAGDYYNALF